MSKRTITLCSVLVVLVSLSLWALLKQSNHSPGMGHIAMSGSASQLSEGGHATFSAVIEIVTQLERNDDTDWSNVDIDALRAHLLDMDQLILNTDASTSKISNTEIRFEITGTTTSIPSIHRMVPAHSQFIEQLRNWKIQRELNDKGAVITITTDDIATLDRLQGLGFYGFMALDSHHQAHHFQIATDGTH